MTFSLFHFPLSDFLSRKQLEKQSAKQNIKNNI